jgi:hypothetical protein
MEGSESVQNNERPKNIRILRIRIHNTERDNLTETASLFIKKNVTKERHPIKETVSLAQHIISGDTQGPASFSKRQPHF